MSAPGRLFAAAVLTIALPLHANAQDFWTKLGFHEDEVKLQLMTALYDGFGRVPSIPSLRAMPAAGRNTLTSNAAAYAKRYSQSAEFRQAYADVRESRKP